MAPRRKQQSARHVIAANLRRLRKDFGLSQEMFADRCGLHRTYIGAVERAEKNVSIDNIEIIARTLGCSIATLVTEGDE